MTPSPQDFLSPWILDVCAGKAEFARNANTRVAFLDPLKGYQGTAICSKI